jgi:hypothetical protein
LATDTHKEVIYLKKGEIRKRYLHARNLKDYR